MNKLLLILPLVLCANHFVYAQRAAQPTPRRFLLNEAKLVDLTYAFDESTIYWPTAKPFHWQKESWGETPAGYWYAAGSYAASEHGGTHIDSPIHFAAGKATTDEIAITNLVGPAAVIDISRLTARDSDYRLSVSDIRNWERKHGRIGAGTIVLVRTGWGKLWPDKKRYLGSDKQGDTANLHFPGISAAAAEFLVRQRKPDGIGIDTASLDYGQSKDFIAHQIINSANIYGLENVANLEKLPATGAILIALPIKIRSGTGGPTRIIAVLP